MPVIATNDIDVQLSFDGGTTWLPLVETTTINNKTDGEVVEYSVLSSKWKKRIKTGGLTNDFSFESKLSVKDGAYEELKKVYLGTASGNDIKLKLVFPHTTDDTKDGETFDQDGIIKITSFGGQGADDLAVINFDFMSNGAPTFTDEEA